MKKKLLALLMVAFLLFPLVSCGSSNEAAKKEAENTLRMLTRVKK